MKSIGARSSYSTQMRGYIPEVMDVILTNVYIRHIRYYGLGYRTANICLKERLDVNFHSAPWISDLKILENIRMKNSKGPNLEHISLGSTILDDGASAREESRLIMSFNPISAFSVSRCNKLDIENLHDPMN
jgi:hypothetical protein